MQQQQQINPAWGLEASKKDNGMSMRLANSQVCQASQDLGRGRNCENKILATPKIADRCIQCMFFGYAIDHPADSYRMWNTTTDGVHTTRDII